MPAPPPLSEPAMVSATGSFFLAFIILNRRKILTQRREDAKAQRRH
jgi:hypothetical protein